jgi:hypothetical protein
MRNILVRSMLVTTLVAAGGGVLAGCYADEPQPQYGSESEEDNGDLVEVSPGVEVVADYDEPVFYSDDAYWVNRGGIWYTSGWYRGGWVRAGRVPDRVGHIEHPEAYRHYRPAGFVAHEQVHGGYTNHAAYHTSHPAAGGVRVRAAVHAGGGHHR